MPAPATTTRQTTMTPIENAVAESAAASAASTASAPSIASAPSFAPPLAASESASAAQAAITYITPQFIVYVRSSPDDAAGAQATPESLLRRAFDAGLRWADEHGITARHIKVITSAEARTDFSALAGFECQTAFYLTFPRHETRSAVRVKMLQMGLVGSRSHLARTMEEVLGWRMLRYPAQLLIKGAPVVTAPKKRSANPSLGLPFMGMGGGSGERKLEPRALLSMARAAGLPGWAELDETFFEEHKPQSIGGASLSTRSHARFDYAIRVPPIAKYMSAVAAIAASAPRVHSSMGWSVHTGIADRIEGDVPMIFVEGVPAVPVLPSSRGPAPRSIDTATEGSSHPSAPAVVKPTLASALAAINATLHKMPSAAPMTPVKPSPSVTPEAEAVIAAFMKDAAVEEAPASTASTAESRAASSSVPETALTSAPETASSNSAVPADPAGPSPSIVPRIDPAVPPPPSPPASSPASNIPTSDPGDAPLPPPAHVPYGSRVYFYSINDRGQLLVDGDRAATDDDMARRSGSILKSPAAIRNLLGNLRKSRELLLTEPRLQTKLNDPVPIPKGCTLWSLTPAAAMDAPDASAATLPLSLCPLRYPWVSVCMGELNFIRAKVTPIVFHTLQVEVKHRRVPMRDESSGVASYRGRSSPASGDRYVLGYGSALPGRSFSFPFQPEKLVIDSTGMLFHPAPPLDSGPTVDGADLRALNLSPDAASARSYNPNPYDLGLLESSLALELDIQEMPLTDQESELVHQFELETRQLTIEAQEEYQRTLARAPRTITKLPDAWIQDWVFEHRRVGVDRDRAREGRPRMHSLPSEFVLAWQRKIYRVARLDDMVQTPRDIRYRDEQTTNDTATNPAWYRRSAR